MLNLLRKIRIWWKFNKLKKKKGFTIIQLLIAIFIFSILLTFYFPNIQKTFNKIDELEYNIERMRDYENIFN